MKPTDLIALLQEIYRDRLAMYRRHEQSAQRVASYEFNNTYQYVIGREDTQLSWLRAALADFGVQPDDGASALEEAAAARGAATAPFEEDARGAREFIARYRPRVDAVSQARHRKMLDLLLGEVAQQQRFFEQAAAGRLDLLGRRPDHAGTGDGVLGTRWVG